MTEPKRLIQHLRKRHEPTEEFSSDGLTKLVVTTSGKTSKGEGILENIWEMEINGVWISDERLVVFIKPDSLLVGNKLDRYANEIFEERKVEVIKRNKKEKK